MEEKTEATENRVAMQSVKKDLAEIAEHGLPSTGEDIRAAMMAAEVNEMCTISGVPNPDYSQEFMAGFEGQPEKIINRGRGSAWARNTPFVKDPGAVQAAIANATRWRALGLKHRPRNNQEILDRIDYYFEQCIVDAIRPTIETMSLALGYSRMSIWSWKNGVKCDSQRQQIIQAAYDTIAAFDADMVSNGQLNPIVYIFRSKNFYDMKDQTDLVVRPDNPLGEIVSVEEIEEKYKELPSD